jgi:hypothetical protein
LTRDAQPILLTSPTSTFELDWERYLDNAGADGCVELIGD